MEGEKKICNLSSLILHKIGKKKDFSMISFLRKEVLTCGQTIYKVW